MTTISDSDGHVNEDSALAPGVVPAPALVSALERHDHSRPVLSVRGEHATEENPAHAAEEVAERGHEPRS